MSVIRTPELPEAAAASRESYQAVRQVIRSRHLNMVCWMRGNS
jgi:hypothetical protein